MAEAAAHSFTWWSRVSTKPGRISGQRSRPNSQEAGHQVDQGRHRREGELEGDGKEAEGGEAEDDQGGQGQGAPDLPGPAQVDQQEKGQDHDFGALGGGRAPRHPGVAHHRGGGQQGGDLHHIEAQQQPGGAPQQPTGEKENDRSHHPQVQAVDHQQVAGAGAGQIMAHLRGDFALVAQQHGEVDGPESGVQAFEQMPDAAPESLSQRIVAGGQEDQMAAVLEAQFPEDAVRGQEAGAVEGAGIVQVPGGVQFSLHHQVGPHRRRREIRGGHQEMAGGRTPALGAEPVLCGQEQLDPVLTQLGGAVQASQQGDFLVLGEVDQMMGRQDRVEGLLVKGHPQEPEKDEGQEADRPPGEPEGREGDPKAKPRPAMSHFSGGFRPQAALASPAIKARTTGNRGREKDRFAVGGFRFSVFKLNEGAGRLLVWVKN